MTAFLPLLAYVIDLLFGDPDWLYARVLHPVVVPGKLASWLEKKLNTNPTVASAFWRGLIAATGLLIIMIVLAIALQFLFRLFPFGWVLEMLLASTLIAHTSLAGFVSRVGKALESGGLKAGQEAVQHLVSRKAEALDQSGVCRAAIESLAENFSDAVIAPLFWFVIGTFFDQGLASLVAYKSINTLDSMWGYRSKRFERFGKFAARLDDAANWIPARLSAFIVLASGITPKQINTDLVNTKLFWKVIKDAPKHRSPNAGWPEAAFAYVLGIRLSGPRLYDEQAYEGPWMGDGRIELNEQDIRSAVGLFHKTIWLVSFLLLFMAVLTLV